MPNKVNILINAKNLAKKTFDDVGKGLKGMGDKASGLNSRFGSAFTSMGNTLSQHRGQIALVATAAAGSMAYLLKQTIDYADGLGKISHRLGISTEALSTYHYAAELSGIKQETFNMALQRFTRRTAEAANGTGEAKAALIEMGVELRNADGSLKSQELLLDNVADALGGVESNADRVRLGFKLFDAEGVKMINMLQGGSTELNKMRQEARDLGLEISQTMAERAELFNDNMTAMKSVVSGLGVTLATEMLPALTQVTGAFREMAKHGEALQLLGQGLSMSLKLLFTVLGGVAAGATMAAVGLGTFWAVAAKTLTLKWTDIPDVLGAGAEKAKELSLMFGDMYKTLWSGAEGYESILDDIKKQQVLEQQTMAAQRLEQQWQTTAETIQNEIIKNGLDPQSAKLFDIEVKVSQLRDKFAAIPGSLQLINQYYDSLIMKAFTLSEIDAAKAIEPQFDGPKMLETVNAGYSQLKSDLAAHAGEITTSSMVHWTIMQGHATAAFGNMSGAMDQFYRLSGEQQGALFALHKAFAIGEAVMATYQAATNAMAQVPYPFNFAAAATVVAAGLANVATIAAAQPGGGAAGGMKYSAPPMPSTMVQQPNNIVNNNQQSNSKQITVIVQGNVVNQDQHVRDLSESINKAIEDGLIGVTP